MRGGPEAPARTHGFLKNRRDAADRHQRQPSEDEYKIVLEAGMQQSYIRGLRDSGPRRIRGLQSEAADGFAAFPFRLHVRREQVMHLSNQSLLVILLVGLVAGWLAGMLIRGSGFGPVGDVIVGWLGALIGNWLLPRLDIHLGTGIVAGTETERATATDPSRATRHTLGIGCESPGTAGKAYA
jgi:uncharacterized membrane protein YeaQ/YmgE (transglycosylase-associated protein family)